jgi:lambda repressor-like predicted transcriptional regulator
MPKITTANEEPKELKAIHAAMSKPGADIAAVAERAGVSKRTLENVLARRNSPKVSTMMNIYRAIKK